MEIFTCPKGHIVNAETILIRPHYLFVKPDLTSIVSL